MSVVMKVLGWIKMGHSWLWWALYLLASYLVMLGLQQVGMFPAWSRIYVWLPAYFVCMWIASRAERLIRRKGFTWNIFRSRAG